jgi:hypothetical protein
MKKYKITVTCTKSNDLVNSIEELSITKKHLISKYEMKYKFIEPRVKIKIDRLFKKHGIQLNIIDELSKI